MPMPVALVIVKMGTEIHNSDCNGTSLVALIIIGCHWWTCTHTYIVAVKCSWGNYVGLLSCMCNDSLLLFIQEVLLEPQIPHSYTSNHYACLLRHHFYFVNSTMMMPTWDLFSAFCSLCNLPGTGVWPSWP